MGQETVGGRGGAGRGSTRQTPSRGSGASVPVRLQVWRGGPMAGEGGGVAKVQEGGEGWRVRGQEELHLPAGGAGPAKGDEVRKCIYFFTH